MFLNCITQWPRSQARMKAALHNKRDNLRTSDQVKTFIPQEREFARDVKPRDFYLHVVAEAVEDQLLRDACVKLGTQCSLRLRKNVTLHCRERGVLQGEDFGCSDV